MTCWSAVVAVLALFCVCDQVWTIQLQHVQHQPLLPSPSPLSGHNRPSPSNLAAAEDEGFLAQLHRRITQANQNHAVDDHFELQPLHFDKVLQQRQQQLQRLQNYFGPEVAEAIEQLQEQDSSPLNSLRVPLDGTESVAHVAFSPEARLQQQQQQLEQDNADALRKYHYRPSSDSQFELRPSSSMSSQSQPEGWEKLLQELAAERAAEGQELQQLENLQSPQSNSLADGMKSKSLQQAADEEFTQEQLAGLVRHSPLEAILAQSQADANRINRQNYPLDSKSSRYDVPSSSSSSFGRNAQAAMAEQDAKTDQLSQLIMKKQSPAVDDKPPPVESVAMVKTSVFEPKTADSSQNFSTQLKKVEISSKNGRQLRKEESYERKVQLSPSEFANEQQQQHMMISSNPVSATNNDEHTNNGQAQLLLSPVQSHLEKSNGNEARQPIAVQLRNSPDSSQPMVRSLTGRLSTFGDAYFLLLVVGCSAASILSVIGAGVCFYKFQQHHKATADVDYPAYGVIGPSSKPPISPGAQQPLQTEPKSKGDSRKGAGSGEGGSGASGQTGAGGADSASGTGTDSGAPSGDRKLAQSAQMYHYQHQKQQMIASEKANNCRNTSTSDVESDEENEEGDYTVYECPGLASTGEIEVTNPLFQHSP